MIREFIATIRAQFALEGYGIHGIQHWERVRENGLRLAQSTGASPKVVELFACLHDSRRLDDDDDPGHGARAAVYLQTLGGHCCEISEELTLLVYACRHHSDGMMDGDVTVLTCWDADRLDLGRVGIRPDPRFLGTAAARDAAVLAWAYERSISRGGW